MRIYLILISIGNTLFLAILSRPVFFRFASAYFEKFVKISLLSGPSSFTSVFCSWREVKCDLSEDLDAIASLNEIQLAHQYPIGTTNGTAEKCAREKERKLWRMMNEEEDASKTKKKKKKTKKTKKSYARMYAGKGGRNTRGKAFA